MVGRVPQAGFELTAVSGALVSLPLDHHQGGKKRIVLPRPGIDPGTSRLQRHLFEKTITAERHIQLDHQGLHNFGPKLLPSRH